MFDEKTLRQTKKAAEEWEKICEKLYKGKEFRPTTDSGIPIKPIYTPQDIDQIDFEKDIGVPGVYPYMRDNYPLHYQYMPWINQQTHGYGLPEHTRARMDMLAREGMMGYFGGRAYNIVWDVPSHFSYDPDAPEARGYVGKDGVTCVNDEDFERMLHDIDLTKNSIVLIASDTIPVFAHYLAYAQQKGYPWNQLRGNTMNWFHVGWWWPSCYWDPKHAFKLCAEVVHFCAREIPHWNHSNLECHAMHGTGANALQQLAFGLANATALADECMKAKIDPDSFMPGIGFQIANGNDFFEYIAMFRAWRRMWAKIAKERYGCKKPASMHLRVHSHTSCIDLTAQQPLVNLIRTTLHALGTMLSGTTAMELPGYDEPLGLPTEEAATLSLRIQQVLLNETNIRNVVDPLGGSYYVENLTNKMEEEAWRIIKQIEEMGGFVKVMESGWLTMQCRENANRWRTQIENNERIVVGWNKYVIPEDKELEYKVFTVDPEVERKAIERIRDFRARRNQKKTEDALKRLNEAAYRVLEGDYGHLMPAAIEAAKAKATIGEICNAFKEPFGWGVNVMAKI